MSKSGKSEKVKDGDESQLSGTGQSQSWSFEQSLKRLEELVRRLEHGNVPLEQSLADYSEAVELLRICQGKLDAAQCRVELLSGFDADGAPITRPIGSESELTLEEKRSARSSRRSAAGAPTAGAPTAGAPTADVKTPGSRGANRNRTDVDESGQLF